MKQHKIIIPLFSLMVAIPSLTSCDSFFDIKPNQNLQAKISGSRRVTSRVV